jgi:glycosyltransferase involved in cell wall biosynthesis
MRILVHDYAGHAFPVQLSRALARRGHEVHHVYTTFFQGPKGAIQPRPGDPANLRIEGMTLGEPFAKYSFAKRLGQEIVYGRMLADRMTAIAPDLVLSANNPLDPQDILLRRTRRSGIPFVFWLQDLYSVAIDRILRTRWPIAGAAIGFRYRWLEGRLLRESDAVIGITADFGPVLRAWGISESKVDIIGNWAPLDEMPRLPRHNAWSRDHGLDGKLVLLYSGSLGLKHDPGLLLRLAERFANRPQIRIVVVSEGQGAEWLRARLDRLGSANLILLPFQEHTRFPEVLASADVHLAVLDSDAGLFSVPSKILNYLASGRPAVAAMPRDNLAARQLSETGAGLVVPPGDPDAFALAVSSLLDEPRRRTAMGNAGREYAEAHFAIEPICDRFEAIFRRVRGIDPAKRVAYA